MKKCTLLIIMLTSVLFLHAQNYKIVFTGSGLSTTIDSVYVLNLSSCTSITVSGPDTLQLIGGSSINEVLPQGHSLTAYPNPTHQTCRLRFYQEQAGPATIEISDLTGRRLGYKEVTLPEGMHTFLLSGLQKGVYFASIHTKTFALTSRIISMSGTADQTPAIKYENTVSLALQQPQVRAARAIIQMPYTFGDVLLLEAYSGNLPSVLHTTVPTQSQVIDFEFLPQAIKGDSGICAGSSAVVFSVEKLTNHTYTWLYSGNGFSITAGLNTDSITAQFSNTASSGTLTVTPSSNCGNVGMRSLAIRIDSTINGLAATALPNPLCEGDMLSLTGNATGAVFWSWSGPGAFTAALQNPVINNITLAGSGVYSLTASNACGNAGPVNTPFVAIAQAPSISTQPIGIALCPGQDSVFKVLASGTALAYQWQLSNDGGVTWNAITAAGVTPAYSGWTTATLGVDSVAAMNNGFKYRCIVTGSCNPAAISAVAALNILQKATVTTNPVGATVCVGDDTSYVITATGSNLSYQWQVSINHGVTYSNIMGVGAAPAYAGWDTPTLHLQNVALANDEYRYRCVVTGVCNPLTSTSASTFLDVNHPPNITANPVNASICSGDSTTFSIAVSGSMLSRKWQVSTDDGTSWNTITAAGTHPAYANWTNSFLKVKSVIAANNGFRYRCVVTGICAPPDTSNVALLSVDTIPASPTEGIHVPSQNQIVWNWNPVAGAAGYKYNTVNNYAMATDVGPALTFTWAGLNCGASYLLLVWAYNDCGHSQALMMMTSTLNCVFICGTSTVTWNYNGNPNYSVGTVFKDNRCWMDRNLGATQVANSIGDAAAFGDLFQWGRLDDGHQVPASGTTSILSFSDDPGHSNFITVAAYPYDWRDPHNSNLWQGPFGINNPCPSGWRLPTENELQLEMWSWAPATTTGAFASTLKWAAAGMRNQWGAVQNNPQQGSVWTSTGSGFTSTYLYFDASISAMNNNYRVYGRSVRCIKD